MNKDDFNESEYIHGKKNYYWHAIDEDCERDNTMNKYEFNGRDCIIGKKNYYWHATDDCCDRNHDSNKCDRVHCERKCNGCPGPAGPCGPIGPCGRDGFTTHLRGMQIQLQNQNEELEVSSGSPVIFDTVVRSLSPFISYNSTTGVITITQTGVFYINWWVAIDSVIGTGTDVATTFAIISSAGDNIKASYPTLLSLQISGNALISIIASPVLPVTLRLVNLTDGTAGIGAAPIRADLTIINVTF